MDKDMIWNIILIVSMLLIINGIGDMGDSDKKTAQAAQGEAAIGTAGVVVFVFKKSVVPLLAGGWLVALILGGALAAPKIFTGWVGAFKDIFAPTPTIPGYVWIGAFFVIIFMMISRKR